MIRNEKPINPKYSQFLKQIVPERVDNSLKFPWALEDMDATKDYPSLSLSLLWPWETVNKRISQKVGLGAIRLADVENHSTARAQNSQNSCSAEYHLFYGQSTTLCSPLFTFTNRNLSFSYALFLYFWIESALVVDSCRLVREVSLYLVRKTEHKPWFLELATVVGWDFRGEWVASNSCEGFRGKGWSRKEHVSVLQSMSWRGDAKDCLYCNHFLLSF